MAEYVEKAKIIAWFRPYGQTDEPIPFETLVSDLRDMKAADVAPVVRGRWKPIKRKNLWGDETDTLECSACKKSDVKGRAIVRHSDFCPNCGADMREG